MLRLSASRLSIAGPELTGAMHAAYLRWLDTQHSAEKVERDRADGWLANQAVLSIGERRG